MVNFRRLKLGDLDRIYRDKELRPLITITSPYKGNSFAIVVELNNEIIGGASGYAIGSAAYMKKAIIKDISQRSLYLDGLIRSLIHFLELDGLEFLFVEEDSPIYSSIGFNKIQGTEEFINKYREILTNEDNIHWINLKSFFKQKQECD